MLVEDSRLTKFVLNLYPQSVRVRYESEVIDLLAKSSTPVRDLADIAICALLDRGELVTMAGIRNRGPKVMGLFIAPVVFAVALLAYASLAVVAMGLFDQGIDQQALQVIMATAVLPVGALCVWLGLWLGRRKKMVAPAVVTPVTLAVGTLGLASIPFVGEALGEQWSATALAIVFWATATGLVGSLEATLLRKLRVRSAMLLVVVGSVVILELTFIVYSLAMPAGSAPATSVLWWYPAVITGVQSTGGANVLEALKGLPAVLTVCTAFSFAMIGAATKGQTVPEVGAIAAEVKG